MAMVFLDGHYVGFGTDSRLCGEFDLSDVVRPGGSHVLALVVPRWSAGTWLEDQDHWFHGGLQRSVVLYSTAETRVSSAKITAGLAKLPRSPGGSTTGTLDVDLLVEGPGCTEPGWTVAVRVETLRGRELATSEQLEVPHWDDSDLFLQLAGAMFTEAGRVRTTLAVPGIEAWSAERPTLYRVVVVLVDPRGATVEVDGDDRPALVGELAVEKVIELVERFLAGISHRGGLCAQEPWTQQPLRRARSAGDAGRRRSRTTRAASPFFPGGGGS